MKTNKNTLKKNLMIAAVVIILYSMLLVLTYRIDLRNKAEAIANAPISAAEDISAQLDLSIACGLSYTDGTVSGSISITNNGKAVADMENELSSVHLGLSLVDADGNIILLDYSHLIIKNGTFEKGETVEIPINFEDLSDYEDCKGIRAAIVQENVAWLDHTAAIWMFE